MNRIECKETNKIGVMQGRLLPKYKGRYQAHPVGYWQDEFYLAEEIGLDLIEFIVDFEEVEKNPLTSPSGLDELLQVMKNSNVSVKSICADYFMTAPIHDENERNAYRSVEFLNFLIEQSTKLGVENIVLPCVDQSSLLYPKSIDRLCERLKAPLQCAEKARVNISLETDLGPRPFAMLIDQLASCRATINYDTGNSAALGYDPIEELSAYGEVITDIHIKDRKYQGGSVVLGTGDTNFDNFFTSLRKIKYRGPFIMQAYRDDDGVAVFKSQLAWIKPFLNEYGMLRE